MSARQVAAGVCGSLVALLLAACTTTTGGPERSDTSAAGYNVQLGFAYLRQGNLPLAKEKLERAEQQDPSSPDVHSALGLLYERLGEAKKADRHFETALRLAPKDPEIENNYAIYLCRNGRIDEGVKHFESAARNPLYRTPAAAYTNAGVCQRGAGRFVDAEKNFLRALQLRPNSAEAAFQLGDLRLQQGATAEARTDVDRFLEAFRATPDLLLLRVRIARATGDKLAEEKFSRRLRIDFPESDQVRALGAAARNPG
ncbi:MAG TPA: type IV pilus biogenesis/stability protein PilW [Steroidobacteraceae bacterium]|nr:type IV pilus biogenesis/stability protein PilW [Steroidobacteraceae bacterium]HQW08027.1 type IV pilus biogenesis/stability protein PilW [Steroidobacteraceae bacterium]HQX46001.1 type IV pilus biogenesis/stability protein PilW [Steroidobacteraceae bacterium]HQX77992.1 type IV pilus biogenesis/stability protein PilW [Steroidobacteraceae bacterium]HQZ81010.1 type IV pilus biogenesis/stability protein PilW [Steroidobacteraceae bacterium]